jgi:Flp pilus assembly protein TadD
MVLFFAAVFPAAAQTEKEVADAMVQAIRLFETQRFADAIPHFAVLAKAMPDSAEVRFMYGMSLLAHSKQTSDTNQAKQLSVQALEQLTKAKELGMKDEQLDSFIALLSGKPMPSSRPEYSLNKEAEKLMQEGEVFFAQSKYDDAIKNFDKALALDPKIYQAAVSAGDSYVAKGDWDNAEKSYQRAIAIDPNRETAYRYSATPFMRQKKYDLARDRYIEAFITEPYGSMSPRGITQWASVTGAKLGHPRVEVPEITFDAAGKAVPKLPISADDPTKRPWIAYIAVRESWKKDKFAKAFPKDAAYRHSLAEEVEALRAFSKAARDQKSTDEQVKLIDKMDAEGLLEAYVLLARADEGIANDHAEYLKNNRPKLRQYVTAYVIQK